MKMISDISELKKGDTVIVKDQAFFEALGFAKVFGDVFTIDLEKPTFIIKCKETESFEEINIETGTIFLLN